MSDKASKVDRDEAVKLIRELVWAEFQLNRRETKTAAKNEQRAVANLFKALTGSAPTDEELKTIALW